MNNWSNEDIFKFLECYQAEPCIWDPRNKGHKDKVKVADAWSRLSEILKKPVKEIKNKKENLMVTFRKHLKRKQDSIRSGSHTGVEDMYEPVWFPYQLMESFLLPVYTTKIGLNSETQSTSRETAFDETVDGAEEAENDNLLTSSSTSAAAASLQSTKKYTANSRRRTASDATEQQVATAFGTLTNALVSQRQSQTAGADKEEDECDLYGKLLAKKIRRLSQDERVLMMYEVDGLFIKIMKQRSRETPSSQYSRPPSSASSDRAVVPNRSLHLQTSFSEPLSTQNPYPLTTNLISNFRRTSTPLPPPSPQTVYSAESNFPILTSTINPSAISGTHMSQTGSKIGSERVKIVADEIIVPSKQSIITQHS